MPSGVWTESLDLRQAAANLRTEMGSNDWHEDPWGWPELDFIVNESPSLLTDWALSQGIGRSDPIDVPKANWGIRPAIVLNLLDRLLYQALVDKLSTKLIGDLSPNAHGWRLEVRDPKPGRFAKNGSQWDLYRQHLAALTIASDVALRTDVVSFFSSIPADGLKGDIEDRCPKNKPTARLLNLLEAFDQVPRRPGLPQRSFASSALANMYLSGVDELLAEYGTAPRSKYVAPWPDADAAFARWMDDIHWFGRDPAVARQVQMAIQSHLRERGLNLNNSKTEVLEGEDIYRILDLEHSAVDVALERDDGSPLEELVDKLLAEPDTASRTSIRFVATRMAKSGRYPRKADYMGVAKRMPHVADAWSGLFVQAFDDQHLIDWFLEYVSGNWSTPWTEAQYLRMFSSDIAANSEMVEYCASAVTDSKTPLPLLATAVQRLTAWNLKKAKSAVRDAMDSEHTPNARRVFAIAMVGKLDRPTIKKLLKMDDENLPTLKFLEHLKYQPVPVNRNFAKPPARS